MYDTTNSITVALDALVLGKDEPGDSDAGSGGVLVADADARLLGDSGYTVDTSTDQVFLQTADDVLVIAPFSLLLKYSSFFETLADLPLPSAEDTRSGSTESNGVIPLPSATSTGLALVISVLVSLEDKAASADKTAAWKHIGESDLAHVAAAYDVVDAYDIPVFVSTFTPPVYNSLRDLFMRFAIAALARDEARARLAAEASIAQGTHTRNMSVQVKAVLVSHAPDYLEGLRTLYANVEESKNQLRADLRYEQPMTNGFDDYALRCSGHKKGYRDCETHARIPSFARLRREEADSMYEAVIKMPAHGWVTVDVECQRCSTRLRRCFLHPVRRHWARNVFKLPA